LVSLCLYIRQPCSANDMVRYSQCLPKYPHFSSPERLYPYSQDRGEIAWNRDVTCMEQKTLHNRPPLPKSAAPISCPRMFPKDSWTFLTSTRDSEGLYKGYDGTPLTKKFASEPRDIKKFRSNIISKKPIPEEELGIKALSMIMINYDFNGDYFNMDDKWFALDLEKNDYEIRFPIERLKDQMMIIYLDVYGNEKKEILTVKNFKNEKWT